MMIALGRRTGEPGGWSPDLAREYLDLGDSIGVDADAADVFRLAAEAMKLIGNGFFSPIHTDNDAASLFRRAAASIAATAPKTPRELVAASVADTNLSFLDYTYDSLPGIGADAEVTAAETLLQAAAEMAGALAGAADDAGRWSSLRAASLFWKGVLVNDHDSPAAVDILRESADVLRDLVDTSPGDLDLRYRYAEALRWVGIAMPSAPETAETERESVRQYEIAWDGRVNLNVDQISRLGVGYGFALANLVQTMREVELANLEDGRAAEDHAGWMLEVLALAAEKEAVSAGMEEAGAGSGEGGFLGGWYLMSSYGWPLGFLSGLVNVERGGDPVTRCDLIAADPYDPLRRAPGLTLDRVDTATAEQECRIERSRQPDDGRTLYQLARVISADTTREAEYLPIAREAAALGVSPALSLVAYALGQKEDTQGEDVAYIATVERTLIESYPILHPFLAIRASSDRERDGLAWYSAKAAALGVPEAHFAMAEFAADPVEKLFRLKLAERLAAERGGETALTLAENARRLATEISVSPADAERIDAEVSAWAPTPLTELPVDADAS
jgi:hypothetical protein